MSPDADGFIVQRVAQGDGAALAELYDRHGRAVYSLAVRILSDHGEAEDLTQDVFALAWRMPGAVAVTLEPTGGLLQPSTAPILVGTAEPQ